MKITLEIDEKAKTFVVLVDVDGSLPGIERTTGAFFLANTEEQEKLMCGLRSAYQTAAFSLRRVLDRIYGG